MNNLMIFEGHDVEVFELNGQVLFNPYHVGECLELGNSAVKMAIAKMNEKQVVKLTNSKVNKVDFRKLHNTGENFLTESGVYKLVFKSHKPNAEAFMNWIADEVLPSIRKNGGYIEGQENLSDEELLSKALMVAQKKIAERDKIISEKQEHIDRMRPKEIFADAVSASQTSILIGALAKIISQNGVQIGQNRLFTWMRDNDYLISRKGTDYNMPKQRAMDLGLFEIKERTINNPDGSVRITRTVMVTGKGQQYFINKFLSDVA